MKPEFTGGSLSFKGEKKKGKKKKSKTKHSLKDNEKARLEEETPRQPLDGGDDLTEAERKALEKKRQREREELQQVAKKTHRERVEEFNEKLGSLTELNDIPRVSILICVVWKKDVGQLNHFSRYLFYYLFLRWVRQVTVNQITAEGLSDGLKKVYDGKTPCRRLRVRWSYMKSSRGTRNPFAKNMPRSVTDSAGRGY
jgi:protein FAM32A